MLTLVTQTTICKFISLAEFFYFDTQERLT